jgi:hypothetical protein
MPKRRASKSQSSTSTAAIPHIATPSLPNVFGVSEISLVGSANGIGRLGKNLPFQFLVDDAFEECGSIIEGEHVAGANMIPGTNLNQDQIDEPQDVGGVRNRLRKWNA